jgi:hypothetical protein
MGGEIQAENFCYDAEDVRFSVESRQLSRN